MKIRVFALILGLASGLASAADTLRGTGDLGLVIERAKGALSLIETTGDSLLGRIEGLGDLSHASVVYSRDARFGYVFGRDGGLTKVDLLKGEIVKRVIQSGNSIGGAISQDGRLVAVSNYEPGGVKIFDADTLEQLADIPARFGDGQLSKVVGLVDAPGNRFVFSLWDGGEIWVAEMTDPKNPKIQKFTNIGRQPYDSMISSNGRYYIAGLYGEDGLALLDLWHPEQGVRRILPGYGKGEEKMPVYKMPHLEGWTMAGDRAFFPAVGLNQVLVADTKSWEIIGRIPVHGQPVFVMSRPDDRQVWVNFAFPNNEKVQVIDVESLEVTKTLEPGKGVLHMEFEPRGEEIWISVRDQNLVKVYDTSTFELKKELAIDAPSGIFFTNRAHKIGL